MQIGQTYKIPVDSYDAFSIVPKKVIKDATLIQETEHLLVFEYKNSKGHICRKSIRKADVARANKRRETVD